MRRFLALLTLLPCLGFASGAAFAEDEPKAEPAPAPAPAAPAEDEAAPAQPPEEPSEDEIKRMAELVKELRAITADIRGLEWKQPVESHLLTRTQVRKRMSSQIKEDMEPEKLETMTRIVHRLGFLPEDQDPLSLALDMISSMAGGFYDPEEKKLYMVAGQDPTTLKPIIVHELLHALEDQYIDLKAKHEEFENNSDGMFAFKCMVEGSAETCRLLYEARDPEAAAAYMAGAKTNTEAQAAQAKTMQMVPAWMMIDTFLHYRTGPNFVTGALKGDYKGNIDALYAAGPTTQEQVLHPERWLGEKRDLPQTLKWATPLHEALGEGWSELDNSTSGELDFAVMLDFFLGPDKGKLNSLDMMKGTLVAGAAREAAEGWDGGRVTFLDRGGEHLGIAATYVFDTETDAQEAMKALQTMAKTMGGDTHATADNRVSIFGRSQWQASGSESLEEWHYRNDKGLGALVRRADQVFWLDGFTLEEMLTLVPAMGATRGVRAPGDTWDATTAADPYAGCDIIHRDRGIGIKLPSEAWSLDVARTKGAQMDPSLVGFFKREDANFSLMVGMFSNGASKGQLPTVLGQFLSASGLKVDESKLLPMTIAGQEGILYPALERGPIAVKFGIASDGLRLFIIVLQGEGAAMDKHGDEIQKLVNGLVVKLPY